MKNDYIKIIPTLIISIHSVRRHPTVKSLIANHDALRTECKSKLVAVPRKGTGGTCPPKSQKSTKAVKEKWQKISVKIPPTSFGFFRPGAATDQNKQNGGGQKDESRLGVTKGSWLATGRKNCIRRRMRCCEKEFSSSLHRSLFCLFVLFAYHVLR